MAASVPIPSTLGTGTRTGPLETTSFTLSPLNSVPVRGSWEITSPLATVSLFSSWPRSTVSPSLRSCRVAVSASLPVRSGTSIGFGPLLTTRSTAAPRLSSVVGFGSEESTTSLATFSEYR